MNLNTIGQNLHWRTIHPYIGKTSIIDESRKQEALQYLNKGRDNSRGESVEVSYYYEVINDSEPLQGLINAAKMILEHGTLKPWDREGDPSTQKPVDYDEYMSWASDIQLFAYKKDEGIESGTVTIAYPLHFFDKRDDNKISLAQLLMAIASEPVSAFSFYRGAKIIDITFPECLRKRFPGQRWHHKRVREYLGLNDSDPIIGTIVKPKTGLTPELFSRCVLEAATAGANFTKADENMHLSLKDVPGYVGKVVRDLESHGFDLGRSEHPKGKRFFFAPHITTDSDKIMEYAQAAVEAGANALMFSPYYGGGFLKMAEIIEAFDVPIYAHTAGMNVMTGSSTWGIDSRIMYVLSAYFGAAFMQITTMNGYLKPDYAEKEEILKCLKKNNLDGEKGMTLAVAGGLGPKNIGYNMKCLGEKGRMFLAGTSVYSHPDGPGNGVKALILAYTAYKKGQIIEVEALKEYALSMGSAGKPLLRAL